MKHLYLLMGITAGLTGFSCSADQQSAHTPEDASSAVRAVDTEDLSNTDNDTSMEILIIIRDEAVEKVQRQIGKFTVLQEISPRVKVIEASAETATEVAAIPEVTVLSEQSGSEALVDSLTEEERLFVEAWRLKQQMGTKQRPGEGASWDDPRFQPPDSSQQP